MKAKQQAEKATRKRYSDEFRDQALKRAEREGVAVAPRILGSPKYQEALAHYKAGTPILFFFVAPKANVAPHKIAELEHYLIETAWAG
ncbi:MAG: hypothetical protein ACYCXG_05245 [Acidiferrobacter sp.]